MMLSPEQHALIAEVRKALRENPSDETIEIDRKTAEWLVDSVAPKMGGNRYADMFVRWQR